MTHHNDIIAHTAELHDLTLEPLTDDSMSMMVRLLDQIVGAAAQASLQCEVF